MNNLETVKAISAIEAGNVNSVYSGKPGCMCGCNGFYRYSSAEVFEKFGPGYGEAKGQVSPAMVKKVLKLIQEHAYTAEIIKADDCSKGETILSIEVETGGGTWSGKYHKRFTPAKRSYVLYTCMAMPEVTEMEVHNVIEQ